MDAIADATNGNTSVNNITATKAHSIEHTAAATHGLVK